MLSVDRAYRRRGIGGSWRILRCPLWTMEYPRIPELCWGEAHFVLREQGGFASDPLKKLRGHSRNLEGKGFASDPARESVDVCRGGLARLTGQRQSSYG
jgi:hypothetical protein